MDKVFINWSLKNIKIDERNIGLEGSPTRVGKVYEQKIERQREILVGAPEDTVSAAIERLRQDGLVWRRGGRI
jgi:electron transfer flavoprotein beta subunit